MRTATRGWMMAGLLAATMTASAQMNMPMNGGGGKPPLSPPAVATVKLDGHTITVKYSAPSMRGREIMGGLVPYGQVWRTGANAATSLTTDVALHIGTLDVPAGAYTLYSLPAAPGTPWMLIVNKQTGQWGTVYKQDMDLGRTPMKEAKLAAPQETMSISFEDVVGKHAKLHVKWASTDVWVPVDVR